MKIKNLKYISIDSVLFDLSTLIDEKDWSESIMREWAVKAFRKFILPVKYKPKVVLLQVEDHKATIPSDAVVTVQVAYKEEISSEDLTEIKKVINYYSSVDNPSLKYVQDPDSLATKILEVSYDRFDNSWKIMRKASSPFLPTITSKVNTTISTYVNEDVFQIQNHEYDIDDSGCLTTTLKNGYIYYSYVAHRKDKEGGALIPDNEDLKEAIVHYCLYRYWMKRAIMKDQGADRERAFHLKQYEVLKAKATAQINMPDLGEMENIRAARAKLVPRSEEYFKGFSSLTHRERLNF